MRDMPAMLDDAQKLAIQLQSVETVQKWLHKEGHSSGEALAVQQAVVEVPSGSNAVNRQHNSDARIQELTKEVQRLSEELAQIKGRQSRPRQQSGSRSRPSNVLGPCWNCGLQGHLRRNCPSFRGREIGRQPGNYQPMENAATNNSTIVVDGFIRQRLTKMLIDSGSAVSIMCQDVWRESATTSAETWLETSVLPVVAANGGALNILGRTNLTTEVAGLKVHFPFLVVNELTQECILGADFLQHHKCVIDLNKQTLRAGGVSVDIAPKFGNDTAACVYHMTFPETTVLPGSSEAELPLQLSKTCHSNTTILKPAPKFMERHGILIAHSLTHTGPNQEKTLVRILNPSPAPVVGVLS